MVSLDTKTKMTCLGEGYPVPTVSWVRLKNSSAEPVAEGSAGVVSYTITDVASEDGGLYRCLAENVYGNASKTTTVFVLGHSKFL